MAAARAALIEAVPARDREGVRGSRHGRPRSSTVAVVPTLFFTIYASHPCQAVEQTLRLKRVPFRVVELYPALQPIVMPPVFGGRTVPGVRFADGMRVQGSRAIMRELERRAPEPALYGSPEIDEAERWGDEVLQPLPRTIMWQALGRAPESLMSFQDGQRLPRLPGLALRAAAPVIIRAEKLMNPAAEEDCRRALALLPELLDHVDELIAGGVLGGARPNAADLQIATSIRLLQTAADVRPLIEGRPSAGLATRYFSWLSGEVPAGTIPADWLP